MTIRSMFFWSLTAVRSVMAPPRPEGEQFDDARGPGRSVYLHGAVLDQYHLEHGPDGRLGRPISDLRRAGADPRTPVGADHEVRFEHGAIFLNDATQATKVVHWGATEH